MRTARTEASSGRSFLNLLCFVVFALYMLASLLLVAIGVRAYRSVTLSGNRSETLVSSLGYVAAKMRALDTDAQAYIDVSGGVDALILPGEVIGEDRYETRIYFYEGALYELFMLSGIEFYPETGIRLMTLDMFSMREDDDGTFMFTVRDESGETRSLTVVLRTEAEAVS